MSDDKIKRCAPSKKFINGSCITLELLIEMAKAYNKMYDKKIKLNEKLETLNPSKYKIFLIKQFRSRLEKICDDQLCWIKQDFINTLPNNAKDDLTKNTLRPSGPQGKFTWLDTFDINNVMGQYEKKYTDFKFYGAVPIDFADLSQYEIANMNLDELIKSKSKIGVIFNLDEHYKKGSHWVSFYADLKQGQVYFFDSYGVKPEARIRKFMRKVSKFCQKNTNLDVKHNKIRHQYKDSECGVYSLHFIIEQLEGHSFDDITQNKVSDDEINKFRQVYFT